jgi:hypothetical protein
MQRGAKEATFAEIFLRKSVFLCLLLKHEQTSHNRKAMSPNDPDCVKTWMLEVVGVAK